MSKAKLQITITFILSTLLFFVISTEPIWAECVFPTITDHTPLSSSTISAYATTCGYIENLDEFWNNARVRTYCTSSYTSGNPSLYVGGDKAGSWYLLWRAFLVFDSSDFPSTIDHARLRLFGYGNSPFAIRVEEGLQHVPLECGDVRAFPWPGTTLTDHCYVYNEQKHFYLFFTETGLELLRSGGIIKLCIRYVGDWSGSQPYNMNLFLFRDIFDPIKNQRPTIEFNYPLSQ